MAKVILDEVMKNTIIINSDPAQKALFDLEKATRKLTEENKAYGLQKKLLEKQNKKDTEEYKLLTATMKANTAEIKSNKVKMKELQDQIGITGLTMKQLSDKAHILKMSLLNAVPGGQAYKKYEAELQQVSARMNELRGNARTTGLSLGSMADGFNRYQAMALSVVATLTGMVYSIQKIIDINSKLSDAQADVMKTTGMTRQEVDELTKSFGLLKTRTSRIDLLGIAEIGGKLGIAKEEITAFVAVMNKAGVALSDSFTGGAEEAAEKLGKIKGLYGELRDAGVEITFESVGSALNDLGAAGTASEANVAEFVTRVGAMPEVFKPSIAQALGLGAAFEESGLKAELAGGNYSKVITLAAKNVAGFAAQMGKPKKEIEDLINSNPTEFFLQFADSLKGLSGTQLADVLDKLKLNDNEVKMVLGAASQNTELFRQKIDLANKSMNEATSLTNEFNIKNTNLAATLEKIKKTTTGWFTSNTFVEWLTSAVNWLAKLIGASDDADGSAQRLRDRYIFLVKILTIVVTSYISYNAAVKLTALWTNGLATATQILTAIQNRGAIVTGLLRSAQLLLAASYYTIRGNTVRATAAMRLFNASASANPIGLVLVALTAVVSAMVLFSKETSKATKVQQMQADIQNEVAKSIAKEKNEVEALVKIIQDETVSKDKKLAAIKRLNEISPEYLKGLTLENIKTFEGKKLLDQYIDSLYKKARAVAIANKMQKLEEEKLDLESKTAGDFRKEQTFGFLGPKTFDKFTSRKDFEKYVREKFKGVDEATFDDFVNKFISSSGFDDKEKKISDVDAQINALKPEYEKNILNNLVSKATPETPDNNNTPDTPTAETRPTTKNPNSSQEEINRIKLDRESKYNEELLKLTRQLEDDKIAAMQDGYEKELLIENQRYQREIDDLDRQKIHADELAKLDEDIAKAKESKDISKYNALMTIRNEWDKKNADLDTKINAIKEGKMAIHKKNLATIEEKAATEAINKKKEAFDRDKQQREIKFNEELAALGNNKRAKARLTEQFNEGELKIQEEFLRGLLEDYKKIVGKENFQGIDLSLLTEEQVQEFQDYANEVGISLTELINKINELKGNKAQTNTEALGVGGGQADIFGFTPDNWDTLFDNLEQGKFGIEEMVFAVSALTNAYGMYSKFLEINEKKQLANFERNTNTKKERYKQQLDSGRISQEQYNRYVEKADDDLAKKKAEIENKQAKRQKAITISQIAMNTAMAIMGIWAQFPKFDFGATAAIMTGVVGALGLAQIAMVAKQDLPSASGYEEGLYPEYVKREQDGKVFKSKPAGKTRSGLVTNTSHFMVAENGPEMVIDNKAWTRMNPAVKDALIRDLQGIKGWENGYYNEALKRYEVPASSGTTTNPSPSNNNDAALLQMVLSVVAENTEVMKDLRDNGLEAFVSNKDFKSMKNIREGLKKEDALRKNNQIR
ncbi:phage tail tape measure protein [Flavobacterium sp. FZUC8N2.13]|uniref:Phage tail tape measure protein n=1 Tax=Flavobacterium zubiriense TaxID=3138075 RepID=A0ABV4TB27_9FLAO